MFDTAMKMEEKNVNAVARRANRFVSRENRTGIPTQLKERMEQSTGLSLDDVRVHYNSALPARLDALAYTKGNQVEIGPGQERHLPHELGHVVQQKLGAVRANARHASGEALNTDSELERQADEIGAGKRIAFMQRRENNVVQRCTEETVPEITDKDIAVEDKDAPVYQTGEGDGEKDDKLIKNLEIALLIFNYCKSVWHEMKQILKLAEDVNIFYDEGINKLDKLSQRVKEKTKSKQTTDRISDDMAKSRELQANITKAMKETAAATKKTAENLGVTHLKILNVGAGKLPIPGATNIDINPMKSRNPMKPRVIKADANRLKARDAIYDYVLAFNPYGYLPVDSDVSRVLKPEGKICVTGNLRNPFFKACFNPDPVRSELKGLKQKEKVENDESIFKEWGKYKSDRKTVVKGAINRSVLKKKNPEKEQETSLNYTVSNINIKNGIAILKRMGTDYELPMLINLLPPGIKEGSQLEYMSSQYTLKTD